MSDRPDIDEMIKWLEAHGPDEWHRVANSWNFDNDDRVLNWIVDNPKCDKATALDIFWLCAPDYSLGFKDRDAIMAQAAYNVVAYDLSTKIVNNWQAGRYKTALFATEQVSPDYVAGYESQEVAIGQVNLPWIIPADMRKPIVGKELDCSGYAEGYAPELAARLEELGIRF